MLKIRLQRAGRKRMPVFKLVVAEHTMPVNGRCVERLGSFVSGQKERTLNIKLDRVKHWLSVGAQPTESVARMLVAQGIKEAQKFVPTRIQKPSNKELEAKAKAEEEAKAKAEAVAAAKAEAEAAAAAAVAEAEAPVAEETPAEEA